MAHYFFPRARECVIGRVPDDRVGRPAAARSPAPYTPGFSRKRSRGRHPAGATQLATERSPRGQPGPWPERTRRHTRRWTSSRTEARISRPAVAARGDVDQTLPECRSLRRREGLCLRRTSRSRAPSRRRSTRATWTGSSPAALRTSSSTRRLRRLATRSDHGHEGMRRWHRELREAWGGQIRSEPVLRPR